MRHRTAPCCMLMEDSKEKWSLETVVQLSSSIFIFLHLFTHRCMSMQHCTAAALACHQPNATMTKKTSVKSNIDEVTLKISQSNIYVLTTCVIYWLHCFPKIAGRSGAFLVYRGLCAASRDGYRAWHRLAMVERTWGQSIECPISLPKGHGVQHCQHPVSHHYL